MGLEVDVKLDFWNEKWEKGETGFHQTVLNPYLGYYYGEKGPDLEQREKLRVFVPLCGKSLDIYWLSRNGYAVVGVECSEIAVRSFFEHHELTYQTVNFKNHIKYVYGGSREGDTLKDSALEDSCVEILLGDFFDLKKYELGEITDIFDRASLIALPQEMRGRYVEKLIELQQSGTRSLLITLTYDQDEMDGPPFSVSEEEVHKLYSNDFKIEKLAEREVLEDEPKFQVRGLTALTETAYKLTRF
jgi:thiopurine S-methyltransferase